MSKVRVLVVDDSSFIRRMLADVLGADPDVEVVGTAPSASLALAKLEQTRPDVITLDVEMPDVSGLDLLPQIRQLAPKLPVIMFSSLTLPAAAATLDAFALGATDYVTKPTGSGSFAAAVERVRSELLPKVKVLGRSYASLHGPKGGAPAPRTPLVTAARRSSRIDVVAIGCSTGGPNALTALFRDLQPLPVPVVIVQHMPPIFTQLLAERLSASSGKRCQEAKDGDELAAGGVWIAPGDFHLQVVRNGKTVRIALDQGLPENSCRPAADVMFRSVVAAYGANALAVVMTGMGQDGLKGCLELHAAGGQVIVQDEQSSVVWGMPGFVARAGIAERVLPLCELASEIERRTARTHTPAATTERARAS